MRALLDTHVWLWMLTDPDRLGDAHDLVANRRTQLLLSAASSWEIAIKHTLGRLTLPEPPATYVPPRIRSTRVTPLPVEHSHALMVAELPSLHRDPFDRLLVAQATIEGVPILTADPVIRRYDIEVITVG